LEHTQKIKAHFESLPKGNGIELIHIPGGIFNMGSERSDREQPIHQVEVQDYYLGRFPVTNKQYLQFVEAAGQHEPEWMEEGSEYNIYTGTDDHYKRISQALTADNHPIVGVSWLNAMAFCEWLSQTSGKAYRLPSEAEWEYAARGGPHSQGLRYAGSNKLKEVGWYTTNSHGTTKAVGLKLPNELGLYDMSSNVWEWCADHWHGNYQGAPEDGSAWIAGGNEDFRVVRGGSWSVNDNYCTVSCRDRSFTDNRLNNIGFRLARY
jgi:formylglycine-generating enzyme required for sulfatase activity